MKEYRRRGRPPRKVDENLMNLSETERKRQLRREFAAEIEKANAEIEIELKNYCLSCSKDSCKYGDCQEIRQEKQRLIKAKGIPRLRAQIQSLYNK